MHIRYRLHYKYESNTNKCLLHTNTYMFWLKIVAILRELQTLKTCTACYTECPVQRAIQSVQYSTLYRVSSTACYTECPVQRAIQGVQYSVLYRVSSTARYTECPVQHAIQSVQYSVLYRVSSTACYTECPVQIMAPWWRLKNVGALKAICAISWE